MSIFRYAVRDSGGVFRGETTDAANATITVGDASEVSLNISPGSVSSYTRQGSDLVLHLSNGETITLQGYFAGAQAEDRELLLSRDGELHLVAFTDNVGDEYFAQYTAVDVTGKWSPYDQMTFLDLDDVEPVIAPLVAPAFGLGGLGVLGAGGAAAAIAASGDSDDSDRDDNADNGSADEDPAGAGGDGEAAPEDGSTPGGSGSGGDDGSGGDKGGPGGGDSGPGDGSGNTPIIPTVDNPDGEHDLGGNGDGGVTITGTGEPGSDVTVTIGDAPQQTVVDDDGTWDVTFGPDDLPEDGVYEVDVDVDSPDGTHYDLDGPTVDIDTTPPIILVEDGVQSTSDVVNAEGRDRGHVISGSGEPGASLSVEIDGYVQTTTVGGDGSWSVTFQPGQIATGEYETAVTITSSDARGNTTIVNEVLDVDTIAPEVDLGTVEGDDVINAAEASDGVTLSGTGEAGSTLTVEFQGQTRTTTVGGDGTWSIDYNASEISPGSYTSDVTITATDAAGNATTETFSVQVDTETSAGIDSGQLGGDDVANAAEQAAGIILTGTAEAGATVEVTLVGVTKTVTAGQDGNWSASYSSAEIPKGTYETTASVLATDGAGNTATASHVIGVDTETYVTYDAGQAGGDDTANAREIAAGVALTGTAEAGATVLVELAGTSHSVVADADGNWSAEFASGEIPQGTYDATVNVTATDTAGNTATTSSTLRVDTEVTNPLVQSVTFADDDVTSLSISTDDQEFEFHALNPDGSTTEFDTTEFALSPDESLVVLNPSASDGTHLVIAATDDAGNTSDTLLVLDDNVTNAGTLEHAQLDRFNIEGIELDYASDANLTLTEEMIRDLSETSDTVTIHGGSDDTVTIENAAKTTQTVDIEDETYDIYTVGDDGVTVVIDQDINVVI